MSTTEIPTDPIAEGAIIPVTANAEFLCEETESHVSKGPAFANGRVVAVVCFILFLAGLAASVWRIQKCHQTPGPFNPAFQGYCDFHNGVYFPTLAFREGVSPYSLEYKQKYPTERPIPFYSPLILALHLPITFLPLTIAEVVYFIWSLGLLLSIAFFTTKFALARSEQNPKTAKSFRWDIFGVVAVGLLLSRGGQQTVFTGYFTFELILAAMFAVQYAKTRPLCSAIGLAVISAKPTYVLPIAGLMLFRGNFRAVILGAIISIVGAGLCFGWIAQNRSVDQIVTDIQTTQEIHKGDWYEVPVNSWTRIDLLAVVAKWADWNPSDLTYLISMHLLLLPAALMLAVYHRRFDDDGELAGISGSIVMATSLIAIYHHVYDALLLCVAATAVALASRKVWRTQSKVLRFALLGCLLMPGVNYVSSQLLISALHLDGNVRQVVTSVNGFALTAACCMLLWTLARYMRESPATTNLQSV